MNHVVQLQDIEIASSCDEEFERLEVILLDNQLRKSNNRRLCKRNKKVTVISGQPKSILLQKINVNKQIELNKLRQSNNEFNISYYTQDIEFLEYVAKRQKEIARKRRIYIKKTTK